MEKEPIVLGEIIDLDEVLTPEGKVGLERGNALIFYRDGEQVTIKITSAPKKGKWRGKIIANLMTDEEAVEQIRIAKGESEGEEIDLEKLETLDTEDPFFQQELARERKEIADKEKGNNGF